MGHDIQPRFWREVAHDAEHAAHGVAIGFGLLAIGWYGGIQWLAGDAAFAIGVTGGSIVQETYDSWKNGWRLGADGVKDIASWQAGWVPWLFLSGEWGAALAVLLASAGAVFSTHWHLRGIAR